MEQTKRAIDIEPATLNDQELAMQAEPKIGKFTVKTVNIFNDLAPETPKTSEAPETTPDQETSSNQEARTELKYWSDEYRDIERAFQNVKNKKNLKEYEIWEADAARAFKNIKAAENKAHFESMYDRDAFEKLPAVEGGMSIEATAGYFYEDRIRDITMAITNSGGEDSKKDQDQVNGLFRLVVDFLDAREDSKLKNMDEEYYWRNRRNKHNAVIEHFNQINDIARKYDQKPLIFRNLMTNDFEYDKRLDYSGETNARAEYDRSSVEGYIMLAWSKEYNYEKDKDGDAPLDPNQSIVAQMHARGED